MRDGTVHNLLVVLDSGGRIAATQRHARRGDVTTLENAIYSPCPVTTRERLPEAAELVDHRGPGDRRSGAPGVRFQGGRLQLFGVNLPLLPIFSIGTGNGRVDRLAGPGLQLFDQEGASRSRCPIIGRSRPTAT